MTEARDLLHHSVDTRVIRAGVAERDIQNQSGHRSLPVLRGYIRCGRLFIDNAAGKVGL